MGGKGSTSRCDGVIFKILEVTRETVMSHTFRAANVLKDSFRYWQGAESHNALMRTIAIFSPPSHSTQHSAKDELVHLTIGESGKAQTPRRRTHGGSGGFGCAGTAGWKA